MNETHDLLRMPDAAVEMPAGAKRVRVSHVWEKDPDEFYQEPEWCSRRLFAEETFFGDIWDPCCGSGTIVRNARDLGFTAHGSDIVDRAQKGMCSAGVGDFLEWEDRRRINSIVCNPPFSKAEDFARHALSLKSTVKLAMIVPTAGVNAARWVEELRCRREWRMTPRPSMPPGRVLSGGGKAKGGMRDYSWLIFERGYDGRPELRWLRRDEAQG
jgi:methylase of polypeptide subunit release factors